MPECFSCRRLTGQHVALVQVGEDDICGQFFCPTCKSTRCLQKHAATPYAGRAGMALGPYSLLASALSLGATLWGVTVPLLARLPLAYAAAPVMLGCFLYLSIRTMFTAARTIERS